MNPISGVLPLRNGVKLGYPFELALRSLRAVCNELVVAVDPTSEDDTVAAVRALGVADVIIESPWNMSNHDGKNDEICRQTAIACDRATCPWVLSLQADEVLHELAAILLPSYVEMAQDGGVTAIELERLYFFGGLTTYRRDWTFWLPRLVQRAVWKPDPESGAMFFVPRTPTATRKLLQAAGRTSAIYHYSRVGDPAIIAQRVRNLDLFYHRPEAVQAPNEIAPYTFELRKLDTYVRGHQPEIDANAALVDFPLDGHPRAALEYFAVNR